MQRKMQTGDTIIRKTTGRITRIMRTEVSRDGHKLHILEDGAEFISDENLNEYWSRLADDPSEEKKTCDEGERIIEALREVLPVTDKTLIAMFPSDFRRVKIALYQTPNFPPILVLDSSLPDVKYERIDMDFPLKVNGQAYKYGYAQKADTICVTRIEEDYLLGMLRTIREMRLPVIYVKAVLP